MSKTKKKNTKKKAKSKKDPKKPDWIQSGFNKDTAVFPLRDLIGFAVEEICKDPDFKKKIKEMAKSQKKTSKKTQEPPLIHTETHRVRPIAAASKKTRRRKSKRNSKRNRRRKSRRARKSHRHKKQKGSARVGARDNIFSSVGVGAFQAEYRWFSENLPEPVDNMWRDICNHIASNPDDVYNAFAANNGDDVERILPTYRAGLTRALTTSLLDTTAYERFVWYMWTLQGGMYKPLGNRLRTISPTDANAEFVTILPALTSLTMKRTIRDPTPVPDDEPILWRGVSRGWLDAEGLLSYGNWSHDCSNDLNDNMVIQDKGYVATSPERHTAVTFMNRGGALFGIMGSIRIEPNTYVITKERSITTTQQNIRTISEFAGESECLLNRAGFFITDCQGSHRWTLTNDIPIYTVWYLDGQHLGQYVFGMILDKLQHITRNSISRESLLEYIEVFSSEESSSGTRLMNRLLGFVDRMHGHTLSSSFARSLDMPIKSLGTDIIRQREGERIDRLRRDRRDRERREREREVRLRREREQREQRERERERERRGRRRSSPIQAPPIQAPQIQVPQIQQSDIAAAVAGLDDLFTPEQLQAAQQEQQAQQAQQAQAGDDSLFAPLWHLMGYHPG